MPNDAPRYLGLDIGTCTGWALAEGDKIIRSGVRDFSVKSSQHIGQRGIKFNNFLVSIGRVDEIFFEKIQFVGPNSGDHGELYKGLLMLVNMYAAGFGIPALGVWPGTLKKEFAGNGKASKEEMCAAAHAIGWRGGSPGTALCHDEADAIALLVTQLRKYGMNVRYKGIVLQPQSTL